MPRFELMPGLTSCGVLSSGLRRPSVQLKYMRTSEFGTTQQAPSSFMKTTHNKAASGSVVDDEMGPAGTFDRIEWKGRIELRNHGQVLLWPSTCQ